MATIVTSPRGTARSAPTAPAAPAALATPAPCSWAATPRSPSTLTLTSHNETTLTAPRTLPARTSTRDPVQLLPRIVDGRARHPGGGGRPVAPLGSLSRRCRLLD